MTHSHEDELVPRSTLIFRLGSGLVGFLLVVGLVIYGVYFVVTR
jgi:hypothetical protein